MGHYVVGVDGCKSGWIACRYDLSRYRVSFRIFESFAKVLQEYSGAVQVAIDIPIGLSEDGAIRQCDTEARRLLSPLRHSSIFSAPARCLLIEPAIEAAKRRSLALSGVSITLQAWNIFPKIRDVDLVMAEACPPHVFEVHPELCFWSFHERPLIHVKRTHEGYEERRSLLQAALQIELPDSRHWRDVGIPKGAGVQRDDLLDATVAAWTAVRMIRGEARQLPQEPVFDARGIPMRIVF